MSFRGFGAMSVACLVGVLFLSTTVAQINNRDDAFGDIFNITYPEQNQTDAFDLKIFKEIIKMNKENVVISPVSLKLALEVMYQASSANTATEIQNALEFKLDKEQSKARTKKILDSLLEPNKPYILNLGTRMYLDQSINAGQKFRELIHKSFRCEIKTLDVTNTAQTVRDANSWVQDLTQGQIKDLVNQADMEDVVILLLNAMYFKGSWLHQFPENATKDGTFYTSESHSTTVPLMKQVNKFMYHQSKRLEAKIVKLPYLGDKFSMYILLPDTTNGLEKLMRSVNPEVLKSAIILMEETNLKLSVPKFKVEYLAKMVPALKELGIRDLFSSYASLPLISRGAGLSKKVTVSNIIQKSGIDVNEVGTVAYTATEISLVNKFGEDDYAEDFKVNKPFMFFIDDKTTNQILFIGKVEDPTNPVRFQAVPQQPVQQEREPLPTQKPTPPGLTNAQRQGHSLRKRL